MRRAIITLMSGVLLFSADYLVWHYGSAVRDFFGIARDLLWFGYHFFSLPVLTRTLVSPFSRIRAGGISITDIEGSMQNITANVISRAVGFVLRAIVIAIGVLFEIAFTTLLVFTLLIWLALPWAILFLLAFSANLLV